MNSNHQPLLKEVYEGGKVAKQLPPWLQDKSKKNNAEDGEDDPRKKAIKKRLAAKKKAKAGK